MPPDTDVPDTDLPDTDVPDTDLPDTPDEWFRLLVEGVTDYAMILLDPQGRVTAWNPGAEHLFGYAQAEVLGQPASLIFTPEDEAVGAPERELATVATYGRSPDVRWHLRRDGSRCWADGVMMALRDPSGDLRGFGKVLRDATDRQQVEGALRASEERYRVAFQHAAVGVALTDLRGRFLQVNAAFYAITVYPEEELMSTDFPSLTHSEDVDENMDLIGRMLTGEMPSFVIEKRYNRKDGRTVWVNNSVSVVRGAQGEPLHIVALTEDITERKTAEAERDRAEAALRESEARLRTMADAIPHIAWTADPDGGVTYYNQRWYDYSGLTFERTRDWGWAEVIHPDDVEHAGGVRRAAVGAGVVIEVEYRLRRADGDYRRHLGRSVPVRDEAGQITQWVGTATDIQAYREVEKERERLLTQAEARAEREAVVNRIGQAVLAARDPEEVQATAVAALGKHLGVDRCYSTLFDRAGEWATVGDD